MLKLLRVNDSLALLASAMVPAAQVSSFRSYGKFRGYAPKNGATS